MKKERTNYLLDYKPRQALPRYIRYIEENKHKNVLQYANIYIYSAFSSNYFFSSISSLNNINQANDYYDIASDWDMVGMDLWNAIGKLHIENNFDVEDDK